MNQLVAEPALLGEREVRESVVLGDLLDLEEAGGEVGGFLDELGGGEFTGENFDGLAEDLVFFSHVGDLTVVLLLVLLAWGGNGDFSVVREEKLG